MEEVVYFTVNNWFCYEHYPPTANFKKWLSNDLEQWFSNDEWCKKNKLCVNDGMIDMSFNYTISAPRSWVEKNCPELLTDEEYEYEGFNGKCYKKYSDFVSHEDENGNIKGMFGQPYLKYEEANFGCHYYEDVYDEED